MKPFINKTGITIQELKELVKDLPESDENGQDIVIWVKKNDNAELSNTEKITVKHNKGDIIVSIR